MATRVASVMKSIYWLLLSGVSAAVGALIANLVADEVFAWLPTLSKRLVLRHVRHLPKAHRKRLRREWLAEIDHIPGGLIKFWFAIGACYASKKIEREYRQPPTGQLVLRRNGVAGVGLLAAAAASALVVIDRTPESRLNDLAEAVGERTVEPRLTGSFRYAPLRSAGVSANWNLYAAAGRIREDAERDPTPGNLHALGLAHLVLGQSDAAVRALEDARRRSCLRPSARQISE